MWFTHKNNIVGGLVIFVMEERQVYSNILLCSDKLRISHHCCLKWKWNSCVNRILAQSCLLNLKWRLHHVSLVARYRGSKIGWIAGHRGLMWRSQSLVDCSRADWSLSGDASSSENWRLESISQMHQPYVVILLTWTTQTLMVHSVVRLSKMPQ